MLHSTMCTRRCTYRSPRIHHWVLTVPQSDCLPVYILYCLPAKESSLPFVYPLSTDIQAITLDFWCRVFLRLLVLPSMARPHFSHILSLLYPSVVTPLMDLPPSITSRSIPDSVNIPSVHRQLLCYVVCFSSPFSQVRSCGVLNIFIGLALQLEKIKP